MTIDKLSTKEILIKNKSRTPPGKMADLIILLHNVRSLHNVGAVFRNADAFGIDKIILSGVTPTPPRPEISKTAIGAEKFVKWKSIDEPGNQIDELKKKYALVGVEQTKSSTPLTDYTVPDQPLCLVFGNEVTGIDEEILPLIDEFIEIPQYGNKHSLNVSVATGVVLYGFLEKYWG
jgi:tRNA G18 (ribose-2'-O)-methylase SpoU